MLLLKIRNFVITTLRSHNILFVEETLSCYNDILLIHSSITTIHTHCSFNMPIEVFDDARIIDD